MSNAGNQIASHKRFSIALALVVSVFAFIVLVPLSFDRMDVSGNLYAQAEDKPTKIEIESEGKSNAEIKAEIEEKLKGQGLTNPDVSVSARSEGMREIKVSIQDSTASKVSEKHIEIVVPDDKPFSIAKPFLEISAESKDKTDEEIKKEIKSKLADEGVQDADISVTTDSSGRRQIEIRVEKEEVEREED